MLILKQKLLGDEEVVFSFKSLQLNIAKKNPKQHLYSVLSCKPTTRNTKEIMSLRTLMFLLVITLLQSCSLREEANWNLAFDSLDYLTGTSDSVLPPIYAYRRDIPNNGFDQDDYNKMEQEVILFNQP